MPLQNRVTPSGDILATKARGLMMGNRGGRIHDPATRTLLPRRSASKRWICCVTEFKSRQRTVMGDSYTELFFLDEVTALASGHRPCFECRRKAAKGFASHWQECHGKITGSVADGMDKVLHAERLPFHSRREGETADLPDGAMFEIEGRILTRRNAMAYQWSFQGYSKYEQRLPKTAKILTPQSVIMILSSGFMPVWHPSAA